MTMKMPQDTFCEVFVKANLITFLGLVVIGIVIEGLGSLLDYVKSI